MNTHTDNKQTTGNLSGPACDINQTREPVDLVFGLSYNDFDSTEPTLSRSHSCVGSIDDGVHLHKTLATPIPIPTPISIPTQSFMFNHPPSIQRQNTTTAHPSLVREVTFGPPDACVASEHPFLESYGIELDPSLRKRREAMALARGVDPLRTSALGPRDEYTPEMMTMFSQIKHASDAHFTAESLKMPPLQRQRAISLCTDELCKCRDFGTDIIARIDFHTKEETDFDVSELPPLPSLKRSFSVYPQPEEEGEEPETHPQP